MENLMPTGKEFTTNTHFQLVADTLYMEFWSHVRDQGIHDAIAEYRGA